MSIIEQNFFEYTSRDKAWQQAMEDEIKMIEKNETWELVDKPSEKPVSAVQISWSSAPGRGDVR